MAPSDASSYDDVPYESWPFRQTHPDRLATVGTLFGMQPAPRTDAGFRVLELGCACGDNLIPLAMQHPEAEFVGLDLSAKQIERARQTAAELHVTNLTFEAADLADMPLEGPKFDYIMAHGVYSWVPPEVRDRMFAVCHHRLSESGIAYISYNVYPGWRAKSVVRDLLLYHTRDLPDPESKIQQSLAFLKFLTHSIPEDLKGYRQTIENVVKTLDDPRSLRARLYHEFLETHNEPLYFTEFIARAERHQLQFLAEADVSEMQTLRFPADVTQVLDQLGDDRIRREQYLDFLKNRPFRQTLLCHAHVSLQPQITRQTIQTLRISGDLACHTPDGTLHGPDPLRYSRAQSNYDAEVTIDEPLTKAALQTLLETWPKTLTLPELHVAARRRIAPDDTYLQNKSERESEERALEEHLIQLFFADLVDFHTFEPPMCLIPSPRPAASPWARRQARQGNRVTNLWHAGVRLGMLQQHLLPLMDGTRDHQQLLDHLLAATETGAVELLHEGAVVETREQRRDLLARQLQSALQNAGKLALLVA